MGQQVSFVNFNINVGGKVYKVKIQDGVGFKNDDSYEQSTAWRAKNGSLFCMKEKMEHVESEYGNFERGTGIFTPQRTSEIKMTEAEYAIFRNIANNDGDASTLTRADIEKAQNLFSQGKFTADITQNLPGGYHGSKDEQDMTKGKYVSATINNHDRNKGALANAKGEEYKYDNVNMRFYNNVEEDKYLEKYAQMSADGTVKKDYEGEGDGGPSWTEYTYKDNNGNLITMSPDYNEAYNIDDKSPRMVRFEGTDTKGRHVISDDFFLHDKDLQIEDESRRSLKLGWYNKMITTKTDDGKDFIELYSREDNDNMVLKNILIRYKDGEKQVYESKDENGNPLAKTIDYTEDGKKVHEDYDKDNNFTHKTVDYKDNNKTVHEDYDQNGLTKKTVDYEENGKRIHEEHDKNGMTQRTVSYNNIFEIYDGNNNLIEKRTDYNSTDYYINGEICKTEGGEITNCAGFDVKAELNKELSEKAAKYRKDYHYKDSGDIAQFVKDQIEGISKNSKTIAKVKAIPADKFVQVLKDYKNVDSWLWFDKASLFTDLMDEYFMKDEDLTDIAKQAFASYLNGKQGQEVTAKDVEMAKFVQAGPGDNLKEYMLKIEDYITK